MTDSVSTPVAEQNGSRASKKKCPECQAEWGKSKRMCTCGYEFGKKAADSAATVNHVERQVAGEVAWTQNQVAAVFAAHELLKTCKSVDEAVALLTLVEKQHARP